VGPVESATLAERHEAAALAEIEWCCELMIAAASLHGERLPLHVVDEVLGVRPAGRSALARNGRG
jgi:hypothetical protein